MIKYRAYFYTFSLALIVISVAGLFIFGLRPDTDFAGGSLLEVEYTQERPSQQETRDALSGFNAGDVSVRNTGERGIILRFKEIDESARQNIVKNLQDLGLSKHENNQLIEQRFDSIGSIVGKETQQRSLWAVLLVLGGIMLYVAWAFRRVSYPLGSFWYSIITLLTLFHDLIITVGAFAIAGRFFGFEVGVPFIAALLTVLGYSVNDTIVVFDRIRENLSRQASRISFPEIVDKSLRETIVRSFNTSFTTVLVLGAILVWGGETVRPFIFALTIGIIIGTYSSICLASPLLVSLYRARLKH